MKKTYYKVPVASIEALCQIISKCEVQKSIINKLSGKYSITKEDVEILKAILITAEVKCEF